MAVSARGYKANGIKKVDLAWNGPSGTSFDIYRDGGVPLGNEAFDWKDTWFYSIGGEWDFSDAFTFRAGVGFDETPTSDEHRILLDRQRHAGSTKDSEHVELTVASARVMTIGEDGPRRNDEVPPRSTSAIEELVRSIDLLVGRQPASPSIVDVRSGFGT